ncbi:MAG: hypothetical protein IE916_01710 [Epsilonproteobacteria bacterium]|nr:hypothetical protein [Campylobacterota bacterium]
MDKCTSNSRLPSLKGLVVLTQTDTSVGFISQNVDRLIEIKSRPSTKPFIEFFQDFKTALACEIRIPKRFKARVRRSKKTTFIVKNRAFRVAKLSLHSAILRDLSWHYSTSANESGKHYEATFCEEKADIIIHNHDGLYEAPSSRLYKIGKKRARRLR